MVMLMIAAGWILIGAQIALFSYLITGYYMLVTSMLSFAVCRTVHPLLILACTLGIGIVLFGIAGFFTSPTQK
ncbi:MAG: hypothetical protein HZC28_14885 [Spirochaetes bacterium]|nr:hypothetical protein [Spirochaetota bacterium]